MAALGDSITGKEAALADAIQCAKRAKNMQSNGYWVREAGYSGIHYFPPHFSAVCLLASCNVISSASLNQSSLQSLHYILKATVG